MIQDDPVIHSQVVGNNLLAQLLLTKDVKTGKINNWNDFKKSMEVAIIQEGTSNSFFQTLYVFHNDWLLLDESTNRLLVVDENKISNFMKRIDVEA